MRCLGFWLVEGHELRAEHGVRTTRVFRRLFGVEFTVIESVDLVTDEQRGEEVILASVRRSPRVGRVVRGVSAAVRVMTPGTGDVGGAPWIWAR